MKAQNSEHLDRNVETCTTRSPIQTAEKLTSRTHMQKGEVLEDLRSHKEEAGVEPGQNGPKSVGPAHFGPRSAAPLT
jgi:hypothetical protein